MAPRSSDVQIRCWAGRYRDQWLVVRVSDRRILTSGSVDHCLWWVRRQSSADVEQGSGTELSPACRL
jgi:hypothetical protein